MRYILWTVILCKYQVLLVFVSESFYNHQLNLQKVANVMPWQAWNGWSAKSLVVDDNPHLRSLIYINKKKGPRADPWWTPAKTSAQDEDWPFKTTLWYLLLKKFSMSFNGVSDITNDLILYINPSCQTLSKDLEMSKKIPHSKEDCSQMICRCYCYCWYSHESEGLKPDWASLRSLFSLRNLMVESNFIFSRVLLYVSKRETGL